MKNAKNLKRSKKIEVLKIEKQNLLAAFNKYWKKYEKHERVLINRYKKIRDKKV